jgi:hypothetical protein
MGLRLGAGVIEVSVAIASLRSSRRRSVQVNKAPTTFNRSDRRYSINLVNSASPRNGFFGANRYGELFSRSLHWPSLSGADVGLTAREAHSTLNIDGDRPAEGLAVAMVEHWLKGLSAPPRLGFGL